MIKITKRLKWSERYKRWNCSIQFMDNVWLSSQHNTMDSENSNFEIMFHTELPKLLENSKLS